MDLEQKWRWAKEARRPYERTSLINVAFYAGEQWIYYDKTTGSIKNIRNQLPSHRVTMVVNQVQPTVRTELAKLTKQRPVSRIVSNRVDYDAKEQAEVSNAIMEHIWRVTKMDRQLESALLWAVLTGKGYLIPRWDKDAGERIVEYQTQVDPYTGQEITDEEGNPIPIPDPNGAPIVKHDFNLGENKVDVPSWFEIYVDPMATCDDDVNWFFRDRVLETAVVEDIYGEKVPAEKGVEVIELLDNRVLGRRYVQGRDVCVLREYVARPNRKNPYGKYTVMLASGTKVLHEGKSPWVEADIEMPLTSITHIPFPGRYQGESVVTQLVPVQIELNKTHSQIIEAKNLTAQPKYLAPKGAFPQGYVITARPGEIVEYNQVGPPLSPLQAPQIPSYVIRELDTIKQEIIEISGIHEASRGSIPSNVRSGVAIAYIQEQDDTRLNLTAHSYERAIASVCTKALKLGRYHYDEPRKVAIVGRNKRSSVIEFTGKDIPEDADVHVEAGSSLPQSVIAKQQFLLDMWNARIIRDQRLMLKLLQFGNLEELYDDAELDIEQAQRENKRLQEGVPVDVEDFHNHEIHIMEHDRFRKSVEYDAVPPGIKQLFAMHVAQHMQFLAPQQQQPQMMPGSMPTYHAMQPQINIQGGEQSGYGG